MENTKENKVKFFAQYFGQKLLSNTSGTHYPLVDLDKKWNWKHESFYLELKPLSSITDEDACYIAMLLVSWQESMSKLKPSNIKVRGRIDGDHVWDELIMEFTGAFKYTIRYRGGDFMTWIDSKGRCEWNTENHLQVYDYLRSKGYALPYMGISVEQLQEYGWIKLKS